MEWSPPEPYSIFKAALPVELGMILNVALWFFWKDHPNVVFCAAFWLSVIWIIRSKNLARDSAGLMVLLGVVLNALVTELNGGVMPVVGMPRRFQPASPVWQAAQTNNHWLVLADQASLHFFSLGDLMLIVGGSLFVLAKLSKKLAKQRKHAVLESDVR